MVVLSQHAQPARATTGSVGEWTAFLATIVLALPAAIYGLVHLVVALGIRRRLLGLDAGGVAFTMSLVAPYASFLSVGTMTILAVGGQSRAMKILCLILVIFGIASLFVFPPRNLLGGP